MHDASRASSFGGTEDLLRRSAGAALRSPAPPRGSSVLRTPDPTLTGPPSMTLSEGAATAKPGGAARAPAAGLESFSYDDDIVRKFMVATFVWGLVGMLVGLVIAFELVMPQLNFAPWFSFGRLRPLHTNAVIFAFAGNAFFTGAYYSTQRLCKARMFSDFLGRFHFWGWQTIIVAAAITLPLGFTQAKEYAELEWPIDIAIAIVWVVFAVNFFGTLKKRRERHLYVALWFYIASIITVAILHIFNNLSIPAGWFKSYPIYAGVQDAFMQWWYGHNAVAFFLTTPFLGLMYYFMPKAADRPIYSYQLSILHFWSLVFIYIWAGPHHLHYTALPEWASTLGMAVLGDALDADLGRHDQRAADAARGVEQGGRGPRAQVLRGRDHGVRHVDLRGPDALDQVGQRARALHATGSSPTSTPARWGGTAS